MRAIILGLAAWFQAQFTKWTGCLSVLGVLTVIGYLAWGVFFGLSWSGVIPTATAPTTAPTASATVAVPTATAAATATAEPTATAVAAVKPAKKPAAKPAQPAKVVQQVVQVQATAVLPALPAPTLTPETHSIEGPQGPWLGGNRMLKHFNQTFSLGSVDNYTYQIEIETGMVALAWGSEIPGVGPGGRTFLTIAGPWKGAIGVSNGAVRIGYVLSSLKEVQETWSEVINCDIQQNVPDDQKKFDLYRWEKIGW